MEREFLPKFLVYIILNDMVLGKFLLRIKIATLCFQCLKYATSALEGLAQCIECHPTD